LISGLFYCLVINNVPQMLSKLVLEAGHSFNLPKILQTVQITHLCN